MQDHVSFVILNYCSAEVTIQCVESILNNIIYNNLTIIIVDNASPDNSEIVLQKQYRGNTQVVLLQTSKNQGFARGNNVGYAYAKNILGSKYIIIANNDTIFQQKDFLNILIKLFNDKKFEIAGPDIITPSGMHQNPHRNAPLTKAGLKKMLLKKQIFLYYFQIKKVLHINDKIMVLEYLFDKKDKRTLSRIPYQVESENVVLLGACLIFSPNFIKEESEAFSPRTFMYGEEDIMTYYANKKGYKILYTPKLQIFHLNGEATKKGHNNNLEKNIFIYKHVVRGCKILLQLMESGL